MRLLRFFTLAPALSLMFAASGAMAQTVAKDAWIRGSVAGQQATGLFVTLTSAKGGKLVSGSSPAASMVEIHEMSMAGDVMKMRELPNGLPLPAGKAVALKPGGYHVMLMGLKKPMTTGEVVPVTLVIEGADKKRETLELKATVRALSDATGHKH